MAESLPSQNTIHSDFFNDQFFRTMNDENKEGTTLLWFDPNIGSREDTQNTQNKLRHINDYVIFHTDLEECITFIQSIDKENILLITSGSKASHILPRVSSLRQIDSIFIFCMKKTRYEHLINEYSKIVGIFVKVDELCQSIEEQIDLIDKQLKTFRFFDHQKSTKDLSKESAEFLWLQLFNHVIARLPKTQQSKQQMIQMCRQYYRGNTKELKLIDQFEQEYQSDEAIRWYTKQSFIYKLINKALRTEDMDLLYTFRFFVGDLSQSLEYEHKKILSSNEEILIVYRGVKVDKEEFNKLKDNQGKLISTNGYLSTSRIRSKALAFAMKSTQRSDVISVLFQIECNIKQINKSVIFADIAELSQYTKEKEVLFDLNACFRIESIEQDESLQIIKMNVSNEGQQITKNYIDITQKETEKKSVSIVFGRLMCDLGEYDKSQKYFEQLLNDPNDEDIAWIEHNIGRALHLKGEWDGARDYYNRAYVRMMSETPPRIKDSAYVFHNIGLVLENQGDYPEALEYYKRAMEMKKKYCSADDVDIASSLNNIGNCLNNQGNYIEALDYYRRALQIKKKCYLSGHPSVAASLNNIGNAYKNQGKNEEALKYYQEALEIREKYYPHGHVDIAQSLNNIGVILVDQGDDGQALDYYQRAMTIYKKFVSIEHPDRKRTEQNISRLSGDK